MNNNSNDKSAALAFIEKINVVDGFDPRPLAVDYTDMNTGETRKRLPVMAQMAWFRLKYPCGRIAISVSPAKDCFIAHACVYRDCMDPVDCFLAEASASRGPLPDKPTVSPREWAQTAAVGIALRNAGFGLQFSAAGESFDEPAVDELGQLIDIPQSGSGADGQNGNQPEPAAPQKESHAEVAANPGQPEKSPLEKAMQMSCPIKKYNGKKLGDLITADPDALTWLATKYTGDQEISAGAKLICENALQVSA